MVEALLAESDPNVAGALRWALATRGDSVLALGRGLSRDDPEVRRRAVGILDDPGAPPGARHRVAQALGEPYGTDVEALIHRLTGDDDPAVARSARALLAMRV